MSVLVASRAGATPHHPQPTVASVTKKLDQLSRKAEALSEKYNAAKLAVQSQLRAAERAEKAAKAAARRYAAARVPLIRIAVAQYQGAPASAVGALLSSEDQQAYLDSLATRDMIATRFATLAADIESSRVAALTAAKKARAAAAHAKAKTKALDAKWASVQDQWVRYKALLESLTAPQQAYYFNRNAPTAAEINKALHEPAPSAAARIAVNFALHQLGKWYVWAAAGPDTYDCSGLTMAAWRAAGVYLPHLSQAQYLFGHHVSYDQMKPGDLVFLYPDVHHVELYIGNHLAISAPQEGEQIKIVRVPDDADFHGATRLG